MFPAKFLLSCDALMSASNSAAAADVQRKQENGNVTTFDPKMVPNCGAVLTPE